MAEAGKSIDIDSRLGEPTVYVKRLVYESRESEPEDLSLFNHVNWVWPL
jgi:hypothetical protein